MRIDDELLQLAEEKGVDIFPFLEAGYSPEFLKQALKAFNPPHGVVGGFVRGLGRGIVGTLEGITALPELAGIEVLKPVREKLTEATQALAPSPYASLPEKVSSVLGEVASFFTPAIGGEVLGAVGKAGRVAKALSKGEKAVPFILGASTAGTTYVAQPEEKKSALRALATGALQVPLFAIPVSGVAGRVARRIPSLAERPVLRTAIAEAVALPPTFAGMEAVQRWGLGEEPAQAITESLKSLASEEGLAQAIAGGILGGVRGFGERRLESQRIEQELRKEIEDLQKKKEETSTKPSEKTVVKETTPKEAPSEEAPIISGLPAPVEAEHPVSIFSKHILAKYYEFPEDRRPSREMIDNLESFTLAKEFPSKSWIPENLQKEFPKISGDDILKDASEFLDVIREHQDEFAYFPAIERIKLILPMYHLLDKLPEHKDFLSFVENNKEQIADVFSKYSSLMKEAVYDELLKRAIETTGYFPDIEKLDSYVDEIVDILSNKKELPSMKDVNSLLDYYSGLLSMETDLDNEYRSYRMDFSSALRSSGLPSLAKIRMERERQGQIAKYPYSYIKKWEEYLSDIFEEPYLKLAGEKKRLEWFKKFGSPLLPVEELPSRGPINASKKVIKNVLWKVLKIHGFSEKDLDKYGINLNKLVDEIKSEANNKGYEFIETNTGKREKVPVYTWGDAINKLKSFIVSKWEDELLRKEREILINKKESKERIQRLLSIDREWKNLGIGDNIPQLDFDKLKIPSTSPRKTSLFKIRRFIEDTIKAFGYSPDEVKDYVSLSNLALRAKQQTLWTDVIKEVGKVISRVSEEKRAIESSIEKGSPVLPIKKEVEVSSPESSPLLREKKHLAEKDILALFSEEPVIKDLIDQYIRSTITSGIDSIVYSGYEIPKELRADFGEALDKFTYTGRSYLEALFGRGIGSRLETALNTYREEKEKIMQIKDENKRREAYRKLVEKYKEKDYTAEELEFLDEIQKNPKEFFLSASKEDIERLFNLAKKAFNIKDFYSLILSGEIASTEETSAKESLSIYKKAYKEVLDFLDGYKEEIGKEGVDYQSFVDRIEEAIKGYTVRSGKKRGLAEKARLTRYLIRNLMSYIRNFASIYEGERITPEVIDEIKKQLLEEKNKTFQKIEELAKSLKQDYISESSFYDLLAKNTHAFVSILRKLPFRLPEKARDLQDKYQDIISWEQTFHKAFLDKYKIIPSYEKIIDSYAKFITSTREYAKEEYRKQAEESIKKHLDDMMRECLSQDNPYSIVPDIRFLPTDFENLKENPRGYVILSFDETSDSTLVKSRLAFSDLLKEDSLFKDIIMDRIDKTSPNGRRFLIFDAQEFLDFLQGKIDKPTILDRSFKEVYQDYIKASLGKSILDLNAENIKPLVEAIDKRLIKNESQLKEYKDVDYFFRSPTSYMKAKFYEMIEKKTELDIPKIEFRTVEQAQKDPYILSNPVEMFKFMKSVLARALGEEVGIFIGNDYDSGVKYLRRLLGVQFSGFAINLGDKKYLGIVFGDNSNALITFGHELYHLVEPFLPELDKRLIYSKFKNTEDIAEAFGKYLLKKYNPPSFLKRVFDKMLRVIEKIKNLLKGMGFVSSEDIFDRILAGEYARKSSPNDIPTAYFVDAWEIARIVNKNFKNSDFQIAYREAVLPKMEESLKDFFTNIVEEKLPFSVKELITRFSQKKVELVSGEEKELRKAGLIPRTRNPFFRFIRDNFIAPLYHPVLKIFHHYYKEANKEVVDRTMRVFQRADKTLESIKKENPKLYSKIKDIVFYSDAEGRYLADFSEEVRKIHPDLSDREIEVMKDAYDKIKDLFDTFFIEKFRETFETGFNTLMKALTTYIKQGILTPEMRNKISDVILELRQDAIDKLFRKYDYEIVDGKRVAINDERDVPRAKWREIRKQLKEELSQFGKEGERVFNTIDNLFGKAIDYATYRIKELDNSFYVPRVRYNGKFELRVFAKYVDENGNTRYAEIEYWDTDKNSSEYVQKNQLYKIYKDVKERLIKEGVSIKTLSTEDWHVSEKPISEYLRDVLGKEEPEIIIMMGRKAPKSESTIDKLSPSEALDFIKSLAMKIDNPEALEKFENSFIQAVYALYADTSYAIARRLYRRRLPKALSQKAIEGYRKELLEVMRDYYVRMTGHLSNAIYMNYYFTHIESNPIVSETFIREPEIKELCNKYIDMLTAPHSSLAQFIYKLRAFTAVFYLGARISSAIMNLTNLATTFLPEYSYIKSISGAETLMELLPEGISNEVKKAIQETKESHQWKQTVNQSPSVLKDISNAVVDLKRFIKKGWLKPDLSEIDFNKARKEASELDLKILETIQDLIDYGTIESSFYRTIREEGMNLFGRTMKSIFDYSMIPFRYTESYGRLIASIALAKHLYGEKKFLSREAVSIITRLTIDKTFGDYSRANRPYWTNPGTPFGAIMSLPTTLKGFIMNLFSLYAEWVGKRQFEKLALSMTAFFILGGLGAVPFLDDLIDIFERISGIPLRMRVYNDLKKMGGQTFADFVVKGVPYALNLIDFSTPLKVELPIPKGTSFDSLADVFLGVYKNVYERILKGTDLLTEGEVLAGLSFLLPMGISMPIQSYLLATEGLRTKYGKQIIEMDTGEPFALDSGEAFLRALGFRPYRLAEIQDKRYFGMRIYQFFKEWRDSIYRRWRNASSPEEYKSLVEEIEEFNKKVLEYKGLISPITSESIRRAMKPKLEKLTQIAELA